MKVSQNIAMLEVKSDAGAIYPTLIWDERDLVLVDACFPMQFELLKACIENEGLEIGDITKIILTHQDIDHIGCVKEVLAGSEAKVLAGMAEAPYIDGRKKPVKLEALQNNYDNLSQDGKMWHDNLKAGFENRRFAINVPLENGDVLTYCGGIEIIETPGHTPGHICLYLKESGVLIAGDALNINDGMLIGPNPDYTFDMGLAAQSLNKLRGYDIKKIISYHGGLFQGDVAARLAEICE